MNAIASQPQSECPLIAPDDRNGTDTVQIIDSPDSAKNPSLHALLRKRAADLIDWTLEAELELLLAQHASVTDAKGRLAYVRNGYQPARDLVTNIGPVRIRIPKVRSRIDRPVIFRSALARPYLRRARSVNNKAPAHFLRGLSMGDLHMAIGALMGPEAAALPGPVLRRLSERWEGDLRRWLTGPLTRLEGISLWLDSIDADEEPPNGIGSVMLAVAIGKSTREQILAVVHGRETEQAWAQLLRNLRSRGMPPPRHVHPAGKASQAIVAAATSVYPEMTSTTESDCHRCDASETPPHRECGSIHQM